MLNLPLLTELILNTEMEKHEWKMAGALGVPEHRQDHDLLQALVHVP